MDPIELKKILNSFFLEMIQENRMKDPIRFLDRLASVLPFAKLQEAVKDDVHDALKEAQSLFEEAKLYLQMTQTQPSPSIRVKLLAILESMITLIESIITEFGIGSFFEPSANETKANFKSQKIMLLFSLFTVITAMLLPLLGAALTGLIAGGTLLTIAALSIAWPFIKPKPTYLPAHAENWTKQVQKEILITQGRKESLDEIANILKMDRHAILVGPSRVGKSLTAKAFAQAVERGDYPELKGKTIFRINTADIIDQKVVLLGDGNNMLNKISAVMGRHRHSIVLVLDEIHMACKNNEKIADQLKTFLDEGGEFPHVIGITTEEEYEKYVKDNHAFALRFDKVNIASTSQDETMKILSDTVLRNPSKPLITGDALDHIYKKSSQVEAAPQPTTSIKLLKHCINRTQQTQLSPIEKKIIEVSNKILSLRAQSASSQGRKKDVKAQITKLEQEVRELQEILSEEQKALNKLFNSKELMDRVTKETYASVIKISSIGQKTLNSKNEKQLKLFLLLHTFLSRSLESHIETTAKVLGVRTVIDESLIEEVVCADDKSSKTDNASKKVSLVA